MRVLLLAAVLVACGLRVGAVAVNAAIDTDRLISTDSSSYLDSARSLARSGRFNESPDTSESMFVRTPGYPAFLATLSVFVGDSPVSLALGQAMVSALGVVLVYVLGVVLFTSRCGVFAALLIAFEPLQLWASGTLLSECLFGMLVTGVAICTALAFLSQTKTARWIGVGLLVAAATFVRPTTYFLVVPLVTLMIALAIRLPARRQHLVPSILALVVSFAIPVGLWQLRNHHEVGSWRFSGIEALTLYEYRAAGTVAIEQHRPFADVRGEFVAKFGPRRSDEPQGAYYDRMFQRGLRIVEHKPLSALRTVAAGLVSLVFGVRSTFLPYVGVPASKPVLVAAVSLLGLFWFVVLVGAVRSLQRLTTRRAARLSSLVIVAYILLVSAGPESYSRFRAPVMGILSVFAAYGTVILVKHAKRRTHRSPS